MSEEILSSRQAKWTNEERLLICKMVNDGESNIAIAEKIGRSYASVCHQIYKLGKARERGINQSFFGLPNSMLGKHHSAEAKNKIKEKARERLKDRTKHPNWHGGKTINQNGYVMLTIPDHPRAGANGQIFEHVVVMEKILLRPLLPGECVHHINGIRIDNRPENLMLFRDNADHQHYHAFLRQKEWNEYYEQNFSIGQTCSRS